MHTHEQTHTLWHMHTHSHAHTHTHTHTHTHPLRRAQWVKTACQSGPPAPCDDGEESVCDPDWLPPVPVLHRRPPQQLQHAARKLVPPPLRRHLLNNAFETFFLPTYPPRPPPLASLFLFFPLSCCTPRPVCRLLTGGSVSLSLSLSAVFVFILARPLWLSLAQLSLLSLGVCVTLKCLFEKVIKYRTPGCLYVSIVHLAVCMLKYRTPGCLYVKVSYTWLFVR